MKLLLSFLFCLMIGSLHAQVQKAPDRYRGQGPFPQLILRGGILVDGTGAPPFGPVDVVIENNRITQIKVVGYPGVPIDSSRRPQLKEGGFEVDCSGRYILPGFVDMHGHIGGRSQGADAEYVFKLWMAHGITTIRDPSCGNGLDWVLDQKEKSINNSITAPRIKAYTVFGQGEYGGINTPCVEFDEVLERISLCVNGQYNDDFLKTYAPASLCAKNRISTF